MADVVFLLGAGASKRAGAPLMADFLDVARDLLAMMPNQDSRKSFESVFKGIGHLQQAHSKSRLDIHNLESVFGAFEMAKTLGVFGDYSADEIDALLDSMRDLIVRTLDETIKIPVRDSEPCAPEPYGAFANLLQELRTKAQPVRSVAVITFNYDVCVDLAIHQIRRRCDYALGQPSRPDDIPLLKLHGSLNWGLCKQCGVIPRPMDACLQSMSGYYVTGKLTDTMPIGKHIGTWKHQGNHEWEVAPLIVPPISNKAEHHRRLSPVWSRAARELSGALDLFIIGYSLPPSDSFFRDLYSLGTIGPSPLRRVQVFDPGDEDELKPRFLKLLGPGAVSRFEFESMDFRDAIPRIRKTFEFVERR